MKGKLYIVLLMAVMACPVFAADSVKDLQKKQRQLQAEIEQTNKMLKQTKKDESATMNKLQLLNQNIKTQKKLIHTLDSEITALNREMKRLSNTRDSLQVILERYKADYAQMVRQSHYARMQQSPLLFLLASDSFQQLARRTRYLQEFAHFRQEQVHRIENTQAEIDNLDMSDSSNWGRYQQIEDEHSYDSLQLFDLKGNYLATIPTEATLPAFPETTAESKALGWKLQSIEYTKSLSTPLSRDCRITFIKQDEWVHITNNNNSGNSGN